MKTLDPRLYALHPSDAPTRTHKRAGWRARNRPVLTCRRCLAGVQERFHARNDGLCGGCALKVLGRIQPAYHGAP